MLTFIIGLSLGACVGAAAMGVCSTSYEHEDGAMQPQMPESRV